MNPGEAIKIIREEADKYARSAEENFRLIEALEYMIHTTNEVCYMSHLSWVYCCMKRFDLREKYLEMAAMHGDAGAYCDLGYMYYYGQAGVQDYEKAYKYFREGAIKTKYEKNSTWLHCIYKIADMYHYGLYVAQDDKKYKVLIEDAYRWIETPEYYGEPYPDIAYRLAAIRASEGKLDEAIDLYDSAKRFLAERLSYSFFWGDIEVMQQIVHGLYEVRKFDIDRCDLYDLMFLLNRPRVISFDYGKRRFRIECVPEDGQPVIKFDGKWYRNIESFYEKAAIGGQKLTAIYDDLYNFKEVIA